MELTGRVTAIIDGLRELYPEASCTLDANEHWQLLFSTRLAAQCTDARVNIVAKELYARYTSVEELAAADITEVERIVKPCGLYHTKARDLVEGAGVLMREYRGIVPDTMEELLKIPGVGRKTASLVLGDCFGKPAVVVDTHCIRLSGRFGFSDSKDAYKVELRLTELIPEAERMMYCHRCVWHGRAVCTARAPRCGECALKNVCPSGEKTNIALKMLDK